jgi:hypothetical protein
MNVGNYLLTLLTVHVIGLVLMVGITVVDYMTFRVFRKLFDGDREQSNSLLQLMPKFSLLYSVFSSSAKG